MSDYKLMLTIFFFQIALFHFLCYELPTSQKCVEYVLPKILKKDVQGKYSGYGKKSKGVGKLDFSATATFTCFEGNQQRSLFWLQQLFYYMNLCFTAAIRAKFGLSEDPKTLKSKIGVWLAHFGDREGGRKGRDAAV